MLRVDHISPLFTPLTASQQNHSRLTGVLINVITLIHNAESLCPVVAAQCKADVKTIGWDLLPLKTQHFILAASASDDITIPSSSMLSIHQFLKARNAKSLQADLPTQVTTSTY